MHSMARLELTMILTILTWLWSLLFLMNTISGVNSEQKMKIPYKQTKKYTNKMEIRCVQFVNVECGRVLRCMFWFYFTFYIYPTKWYSKIHVYMFSQFIFIARYFCVCCIYLVLLSLNDQIYLCMVDFIKFFSSAPK